MSDSNTPGETGTQAAQNGSSSESSDVSIEKLNPEEPDITESKPTEDNDEEKDNEGGAKLDTTKESETDDPSQSKDKEEESKSKQETKVETVSSPSTSSSKVALRDVASVDDSEDEDEDDFEDETLMERLVGLTEMFPPGLITGISNLGVGSVSAAKWSYSAGRNLTWIIFSSAALLFLPAMLESERATIEEQEKMRKQQMLLGPSSALASAQNAPLPPNPA